MKEVRIGTILRPLRKKKGFTLVKLAAATNIQIATLSRIENNKETGTVETHLKLAHILAVDVTEFYREVDVDLLLKQKLS